MTAYYNEIDPKAAAWLRELINQGHIAPGVVDERSIVDVPPTELSQYTQCHFFAGIGVWSYALRRAGWSDDRPVWTGSCPCQPFSAAGKGDGFDDERHLWPSFYWLIAQCRPAVVFGEQVASKDAEPWIDLVQDDLEALDYAVGAVPFPSAGVGAPHIRDRLYWVAHTLPTGRPEGRSLPGTRPSSSSSADGLADDDRERRSEQPQRNSGSIAGRETGELGPHDDRRDNFGVLRAGRPLKRTDESPSAGPTNGLWRDADWIFCRDGKWRPVEPGTFPLAHGAPARVGRLRGYGNAINAEAARVFIESYLGGGSAELTPANDNMINITPGQVSLL